jgi:hypothetical protein
MMSASLPAPHPRHRHQPVVLHLLAQRLGIPYEVERTTCGDCAKVLAERIIRRARA